MTISPQSSICLAGLGPALDLHLGSAALSPRQPWWDVHNRSSPVWGNIITCVFRVSVIIKHTQLLMYVFMGVILTCTEKRRRWQLWLPVCRNRLLGCCRSDSSRTARGGTRLSSKSRLYQTAVKRKKKVPRSKRKDYIRQKRQRKATNPETDDARVSHFDLKMTVMIHWLSK